MNKKTLIISILILASISFAGLARSFGQPVRVPTATTIPTITTTSAGVVFECNPSIAFPGSVITGSSGFIRVKCPTGGYVQLGTTNGIALTPSFALTQGYSNISIVLANSAGNPCNYHFQPLQIGNVTVLTGVLLNGTALTFSSSPQPGQFLANVYDYCLQYSSVQTTLQSFTVTWT